MNPSGQNEEDDDHLFLVQKSQPLPTSSATFYENYTDKSFAIAKMTLCRQKPLSLAR